MITTFETGDYDAIMVAPERYRQASSLLERNVASEVVLSGVTEGSSYRLCGTAAECWQALSEPRTVAELVVLLAALYDTSPRSIASDIAGLVTDLLDRDLVERECDGA